ncbi:hypothetical protein OHA25_02200 [Nonomuraea sp. NBC_00507]|uniref:hypothetical protein n=1 Tax=Nonomuraea sp. NBC_00507 TaxID=2976002 RepID=UPI002E193761
MRRRSAPPAHRRAWAVVMSLAGRSFVVTGARGGAYGPGTPREPYDHQERYLRGRHEESLEAALKEAAR